MTDLERIEERLERIEERLDEITDLIRTEGVHVRIADVDYEIDTDGWPGDGWTLG